MNSDNISAVTIPLAFCIIFCALIGAVYFNLKNEDAITKLGLEKDMCQSTNRANRGMWGKCK